LPEIFRLGALSYILEGQFLRWQQWLGFNFLHITRHEFLFRIGVVKPKGHEGKIKYIKFN